MGAFQQDLGAHFNQICCTFAYLAIFQSGIVLLLDTLTGRFQDCIPGYIRVFNPIIDRGIVAGTFNLATYAIYSNVVKILGKLYSSEVVTYVGYLWNTIIIIV